MSKSIWNRRMFIKKSFSAFFAVVFASLFRPLHGKGSGRISGGKKVVIIGSGLTGLCSAAILAKQNYDVTVLEANPKFIGGQSRSYNIDGLSFCVGPQYVWNFGVGDIGNQVLRYLNLESQIRFTRMDENGFENYIIGSSKPVPIPMGMDKFEALTVSLYPAFNDGIKKFFSVLAELIKAGKIMERKGLYLCEGNKAILSIAFDMDIPFSSKTAMLKYNKYSLAQLFDSCGLKGEVRKFLFGHSGVFAEDPDDLSVVVYAAATGSYHAGAYVPEKTFDALLEGMAQTIRKFNGKILTGKTVTRIINDGEVATAVACSDGSRYDCDIVFSNLSPRLTCKLISSCDLAQYEYMPSNSLVTCCIVLRDSEKIRKALRLKNYWWQDDIFDIAFKNPDMTKQPGMMFIGSQSANTSVPGANQKNDSMVIFVPGNFDQSKKAKEKGEDSYKQLKAKIAENIVKVLDDKIFPGIKDKIVSMQVETPWDIYAITGAEAGNVYGKRLTAESILTNQYGTIQKIENLYTGCATIGLPGVATCFRTATIVCKEISGVKVG